MTDRQAKSRSFADVRHWVFDLDNTLYPARYRLFDQIDIRMGAFIARMFGIDRDRARRIQKDYFHRYGTTLRGLMKEHGADPKTFLDYVHDIDHSVIAPDPALDASLARLEGHKWVFTNGTVEHAEAVMNRLGVSHHIDEVFDIAHAGYLPKPFPEAYDIFIRKTGIEPTQAAMFEDIARNLKRPHEMGMTTVLVDSPDNDDGCQINRLNDDVNAEYVHHVTHDLGAFLNALADNIEATQKEIS